MSILKQTKLTYSKSLNILLAVLILLSPIVSSANTLLMDDMLFNKGSMSHPAQQSSASNIEKTKASMEHETCHKPSAQSNISSVEMTNDCCDKPCLCAQASCQSSSATFYNSDLTVNTDRPVFDFMTSLYLNPQSSPTSPPPIS